MCLTCFDPGEIEIELLEEKVERYERVLEKIRRLYGLSVEEFERLCQEGDE